MADILCSVQGTGAGEAAGLEQETGLHRDQMFGMTGDNEFYNDK
jgi:hypothetical protein